MFVLKEGFEYTVPTFDGQMTFSRYYTTRVQAYCHVYSSKKNGVCGPRPAGADVYKRSLLKKWYFLLQALLEYQTGTILQEYYTIR